MITINSASTWNEVDLLAQIDAARDDAKNQRAEVDRLRTAIVRLERIRKKTAQLLSAIEASTHRPDQVSYYQGIHAGLCRERMELLKAAGVEGRVA